MAAKARTYNGNISRRRLRVGVTLFIRDEHQSIWENGIFQNCFFLLKLLKRSPDIEWCGIINGGPGDPTRSGEFLSGAEADVISMTEALDSVDVVIELSAQLDPDWGRQFVARGGHIIAMRVANDFVIDAERMSFGLPPGLLMSGVPYDEIWTLPAFEKTCAAYYEAGCRAPVRVMQHLWSPVLLEKALAARSQERRFAYVPGRQRWRIAILEPNICSVKTSHIPLLACDMAYRMRPSALEVVRVFNTGKLRENATFINFARSTDLVQHGIATFEGRLPIIDVMGEMAEAIVSHHWENAQNYLYYEALYGGFPLIHNSTMIDGCGYYYENFDPQDGGRALIQAVLEHDLNLDAYKADAARFLERLNPISDANVRLYSSAITAVVNRRRSDRKPRGLIAVADVRP